MISSEINKKRIRDTAPYRKSISMTELDMKRAQELEIAYNIKYSSEAPFNFSKTISKALEIACLTLLTPAVQTAPQIPSQTSQQSKLQTNQLVNIQTEENKNNQKSQNNNTHKKFLKQKRRY